MSRSKVAREPCRLRMGDYPSAGDQLDEMWRAIEALAAGEPLPASATEMIDKIRAVKARFPKTPRR